MIGCRSIRNNNHEKNHDLTQYCRFDAGRAGRRLRRLEETGKQREILKKEAEDLSRQRNDYLRDKVDRAGGAKESLDQKLYGAIKDQAKTKGLRYESDSASF